MSGSTSTEESGVINTLDEAMAELDRRAAARGEKPEATEAAEEETDPPAQESAAESEEVATEDKPEPEVTVKTSIEFDGKTLEIPEGTPPELVEAVSTMAKDLKADYTQKTQAVAEERRAVEAVKQQTVTQSQQLHRTQQALAVMARNLLGAEPDLALAQQDIGLYTVQKGLWEQRVNQFRSLMQQGEQLTQQQQHQVETDNREYRQKEAQALLKAIPDLTKPEKFTAFRAASVEAAGKYGIGPEEVAQITDHRLVLALRDLAEFHKTKAATGELKTKLQNVPPRTAKPGAASSQTPAVNKNAEALKAFKKSAGTDRDLKRYLAATS